MSERGPARCTRAGPLSFQPALAAAQNTCTIDIETVLAMEQQGVVDLIEQFEAGGIDSRVQQYAAGCLSNVRRTLVAEQARQQARQLLEAQRRADAEAAYTRETVPVRNGTAAAIFTAVTGVRTGPAVPTKGQI